MIAIVVAESVPSRADVAVRSLLTLVVVVAAVMQLVFKFTMVAMKLGHECRNERSSGSICSNSCSSRSGIGSRSNNSGRVVVIISIAVMVTIFLECGQPTWLLSGHSYSGLCMCVCLFKSPSWVALVHLCSPEHNKHCRVNSLVLSPKARKGTQTNVDSMLFFCSCLLLSGVENH